MGKYNSRKRVYGELCFQGNGPRGNEIRGIGPWRNGPRFTQEFKRRKIFILIFSPLKYVAKIDSVPFPLSWKKIKENVTKLKNSKSRLNSRFKITF
jgi:hypothetical protein